MRKSFSGWHMAGILVGGFAVVVAVNLLMASLAVGSFGGVVVENSYVASQKFNGWLAASAAENQLGWKASIRRNGDGYLEVATEGAPEDLFVLAELRHPLGKTDTLRWELLPDERGGFVSPNALPEGRWLVRLTLSADGEQMKLERPLG